MDHRWAHPTPTYYFCQFDSDWRGNVRRVSLSSDWARQMAESIDGPTEWWNVKVVKSLKEHYDSTELFPTAEAAMAEAERIYHTVEPFEGFPTVDPEDFGKVKYTDEQIEQTPDWYSELLKGKE